MTKKKKITIIILFLIIQVLLSSSLAATDECRKELTAHLKELFDGSGLYWSAEITGALGTTDSGSDLFSRDSLFLSLDWQLGNRFNIYFEGGIRYFDGRNLNSKSDNQNDQTGTNPNGNRYGWDENRFSELDSKLFFKLKESFVQYKTDTLTISTGLKAATSEDKFLLDERTIGLFIDNKFSDFKLSIYGGTAVKNLTYGDKGWLKKSINPEELIIETYRPSNKIGESNYIGASLSYSPGKGLISAKRGGYGSENAFPQEDEFLPVETESFELLEKTGILINYEFGDQIGKDEYLGENRFYYGLFGELNIFDFFDLTISGIIQSVLDNRAFGYYLRAGRSVSLGNLGDIYFNTTYVGYTEIEGALNFAPSFTHYSKGEILGLEPLNAPFYQVEIDYTFPTENLLRLSVGYFRQTEKSVDEAAELDITSTIQIYRGLRIYLIYSNVDSLRLNQPVNYFGIETRYTF